MKPQDNQTYQRILDASERLFAELGYAAVSLQDIAQAVEMRHASLYYYAPKGKEQLYIAVMERGFKRHAEGLMSAIIDAGSDLRAQVHAVADWFVSRPPIDLGRIVRSDLPLIEPQQAQRLIELSLESLRMPIATAIRGAVKRGEVQVADPDFAAMGLVALVQSVHNIPRGLIPSSGGLTQTAHAAADMLLDGWLKR
ncbi:MAG: TetR/AcrR family transcriptional regulator [Anaerolineae bacterium]|nr:TetR/AcrR family transcriptional regulator [Anaerolineae bacterium]